MSAEITSPGRAEVRVKGWRGIPAHDIRASALSTALSWPSPGTTA